MMGAATLVQRAHAITEFRQVGSMRSELGHVIYTYLQPVCLCGWEGGLHYGADGMDKASARAEHVQHVRDDNARLAARAVA